MEHSKCTKNEISTKVFDYNYGCSPICVLLWALRK